MHEHADRDHTEPPSTEEGPILPAELWDKATYTPGRPIDMPAPPAVTIDTATAGMRGLLGINHVHDLTTGTCVRNRYGVPCDAPRRDYQIGGFLPGGVQVARFTAEPTGEDAAALTALADALDTTPAQLAAGPEHDERLRKYAAIAVEALDLDVRRAHDRMVADDIATKFLTLASAELHEHGRDVRDTARKVYTADIAGLQAERDQWRTNFEQLSARNLAMAERHSEALHRATERAKTAEHELAIAWGYGGDRLNEKQRAALDRMEAEVKERWNLHASTMHYAFDEQPRPGYDPTVRVSWGDGERVAEATINRHGNGGYWIADVDLLHNDFDDECGCDHCKAYRDESCPHTCSCTSDQECPHDCPCEGGA